MKLIRLFCLLIFLSGLSSYSFGQDFSLWNSIRNSSYTQDNEIYIRTELTPVLDARTFLFYFTDGFWNKTGVTNINGQTYQSIISADRDNTQYIRYHTTLPNYFFDFSEIFPNDTDSLVVMMAGYKPTYPIPLNIDHLAKVADDVVGNIDQDIPDYLDITGSYFSFSDTEFHTAMSNNHTSFPTGPLFGPFNLYTTLIINPETVVEDSVFYGIVYANIIGMITPGLYRFSGVSLDSVRRIGGVTHSVSDNHLFLSCRIEDLTSDPYFGDWPNISNSLVVMPMTMRVNSSLEFIIADTGTMSVQNFSKYYIEPIENRTPDLNNFSYRHSGGYTHLNIDYYDPDSHFPIISKLVFSDMSEVDLFPLSFDYSERVRYTAVFPQRESQGVIKFSDNGFEFVELPVHLSADNDDTKPPLPDFRVYPNPFVVSSENRYLKLLSEDTKIRRATVYDLKGRVVKSIDSIAETELKVWNGSLQNGSEAASGVYFLQIDSGDEKVNYKFMLIR